MPDIRHKTLKPFVECVIPSDPLGHFNLTLVPLRGGGRQRVDYILSAEAISAGLLTVAELRGGGSVPELLAINESDKMILLLDGEELVGAKQNRILNTSVLLPSKSETRIPVSCVEQGRWHHVSRTFRSGSHSPSSLRRRKSKDVSRAYMAHGRALSDQRAVWQQVVECLCQSGIQSPTMAIHDILEQRRDLLSEYVNAFVYCEGTRGVIAATNGMFAAMDLFDNASTLRGVWSPLVTGYAMDALFRPASEEAARQFTCRGAEILLERLSEIECLAFASVGTGEDWRFETTDILGQALVAGSVCVHLSAFPNGRGMSDQDPPSSSASPLRRCDGRDDAVSRAYGQGVPSWSRELDGPVR